MSDMNSPEDWTEYDALNVLALPLFRWTNRKRYAIDGGWDAEIRSLVYSNGTEHGFATEAAEVVLDIGPMLRRVLFAGVRALRDDPAFEAYTLALSGGGVDRIVALEREAADLSEQVPMP